MRKSAQLLTPAQAEVKETFFKLNDEKLAIQAKLQRAHIFGQCHTKGLVPTLCLDCFVDTIYPPRWLRLNQGRELELELSSAESYADTRCLSMKPSHSPAVWKVMRDRLRFFDQLPQRGHEVPTLLV
jgi:hypothetical protein